MIRFFDSGRMSLVFRGRVSRLPLLRVVPTGERLKGAGIHTNIAAELAKLPKSVSPKGRLYISEVVCGTSRHATQDLRRFLATILSNHLILHLS